MSHQPFVVVLSGAGISAESGIRTFRDHNGLWEDHDIMEVASPEAWNNNPNLVNKFYNKRRAQLADVEPNSAHFALADFEKHTSVQIITQNVDDLHERAGSQNVLHLHGELKKVRSTKDPAYILNWEGSLTAEDLDPNGFALRPHIVWFGEQVPAIEQAIQLVSKATIVIVVGTSMQVYPAASLITYAPDKTKIYYIDPSPNINGDLSSLKNITVIADKAGSAVPKLVAQLTLT